MARLQCEPACFGHARRGNQIMRSEGAARGGALEMRDASPTNWQLTILLPLDVVANQLMRTEADLRFLNMKALVYAKQREDRGLAVQIAGRLEKVSEVLDRIGDLVSDIAADSQPQPATRARNSSKGHVSGKPLPELDD
jgi:hypothetical protein